MTDNDLTPITALNNLTTKDLDVTKKHVKVVEAWTVVEQISTKWENMVDENRRKTTTNFLIEMMGSGFWAWRVDEVAK